MRTLSRVFDGREDAQTLFDELVRDIGRCTRVSVFVSSDGFRRVNFEIQPPMQKREADEPQM
jgi:hypothetical protein